MARHKIDPAVSRKAYAAAEKALKSLHAEQFALLLDEAYESMGVESPRQRRERLANEAAQAAFERRAARAAREAEKVQEAIEFLRKQGIDVPVLDGLESFEKEIEKSA